MKNIILWDIENTNQEHYLSVKDNMNKLNAKLVVFINENAPIGIKNFVRTIEIDYLQTVPCYSDAADKGFISYIEDNKENSFYLITNDKKFREEVNKIKKVEIIETKPYLELSFIKDRFDLFPSENDFNKEKYHKYEQDLINELEKSMDKEKETFKGRYFFDWARGFLNGSPILFEDKYVKEIQMKKNVEYNDFFIKNQILNLKYIYKEIKKFSNRKANKFKDDLTSYDLMIGIDEIKISEIIKEFIETKNFSEENKLFLDKENDFYILKLQNLGMEEESLNTFREYYPGACIDNFPKEYFYIFDMDKHVFSYIVIEHSTNTKFVREYIFENKKVNIKNHKFAIV